HSFFMNRTEEFYRFYREKMLFPSAAPNDAHLVLKKLQDVGKLRGIITQNIDNLHFKAGSKTVYELHGSVYRNYCQKCHKPYDLNYILNSSGIPKCSCGGIIKPDVVLYGEGLNQNTVTKSIEAISQADVLIVGGTSLNVYPAASFLEFFKGKHLILINKSKTSWDSSAEIAIDQNIGETFLKISQILSL
ncbi:MAG: NAD-dependent protein deacylase, partial [Oscillospiraceae bacterium]